MALPALRPPIVAPQSTWGRPKGRVVRGSHHPSSSVVSATSNQSGGVPAIPFEPQYAGSSDQLRNLASVRVPQP